MVRGSTGEIETIFAENIRQSCEAEHVETPAFLKALQFAKDFGIAHFVLEG